MRRRVYQHFMAMFGMLNALLVCYPGQAHHGFANHFDPEEKHSIEGIVTQFDFTNPHVTIYLDVKNNNGETETWIAETGGSSGFLRSGRLSRDSIKLGDRVQIVGHPARSLKLEIRANHITLPDGNELNMNNPYVEIPFLKQGREDKQQ